MLSITPRLVAGALLFSSLAFAGCGDSGGSGGMPDQYQFGGDRPVFLNVPSTYDNSVPTPLLVVLHGFGANAYTQLAYTKLDQLVEEQGILMVAPEGTTDQDGKQFWNATDACCDFYDTGVDDVAYISGLIEEISSVWNVDPSRVYIFGHSNGGYMAYRMACDRADLISAIVSLAGATYLDTTACDPSADVSVLQIHGTADAMVPYDGGTYAPGAIRSTEIWAGYDGCTGQLSDNDRMLDLDTTLAGDETTVQSWGGCPSGTGVELWTIDGGGHIPAVTDDFRSEVWSFLAAHPRN